MKNWAVWHLYRPLRKHNLLMQSQLLEKAIVEGGFRMGKLLI